MSNEFVQYWHANLIADTKKNGMLIIGNQNVGKSEFCYYLIENLNYDLVADDLVRVVKGKGKGKDCYEGFLCNKDYLGLMHHKEKGFIKMPKALLSAQIYYVVYLYCHIVCQKQMDKALCLELPMIMLDVNGKSWQQCWLELQNILG